jgi:hypothetical protein
MPSGRNLLWSSWWPNGPRYLQVLTAGECRRICHRALPSISDIRRTHVDGQPSDPDQDDHQEGCEHQDLAIPADLNALRDSPFHGFFGSIRNSVSVVRQNPLTPQAGAMICSPGKKIGTT